MTTHRAGRAHPSGHAPYRCPACQHLIFLHWRGGCDSHDGTCKCAVPYGSIMPGEPEPKESK